MNVNQKLTKRLVESIKPDKDEELLVWDSEIKGFGLRIYPTGRRTYFVQYRNEFQRTRRKKIGVHGQVTTEQAREMAKGLLGDVAKGGDPSQEVQTRKIKPSMADLAKEYLETHAESKKKSHKQDRRMLEKIILKRWPDKRIEEISTYDIQYLHHELKKTPYVANRVRSLLSKMFNVAIQWKWLGSNPVNGVQKYQEQKRDRWLNEEELQRLWDVLETYHSQRVSRAIWLLVLTGSRCNEVLGATWDQFDLDKGVWTKPSHNTKQKRIEHLPLSSQAIDLLKVMKEEGVEKYLFPGNIPGQPLKDIKKAWNTIRNKANLPNVRIHDIRHTYASHLVSSGLSLSIVGKLLGHTQAATTQRYAHLADAPLRQATELFGKKAQKISDRNLHEKT
jgi:integrase